MSPELWWLAGGAVVAGLVQGLSGFAFAMVSMSIWVWGVEPRTATVMAVFGGLVGQVLGLFTVRRGWRWDVLWPYLAGAAAGAPLGVWILPYLNPAAFKLTLGIFLLLCCPTLLMAPRLPPVRAGGPLADAAVGAVGGVMGGIGGFSGVLPSLWCTLRAYPKDLQRGVIQNFNLSALAVTMAGYALSGAVSTAMVPGFAVVAAALLLPAIFGARLYAGMSAEGFRRIVLLLLTLAGLAMVSAALLALLGQ